jgi:hypothetical protein
LKSNSFLYEKIFGNCHDKETVRTKLGEHLSHSNLDRSGSQFQSRSRSRLKIVNQTPPENFQSKSAENISIKVCLQKVKLILRSNNPGLTTEQSVR